MTLQDVLLIIAGFIGTILLSIIGYFLMRLIQSFDQFKLMVQEFLIKQEGVNSTHVEKLVKIEDDLDKMNTSNLKLWGRLQKMEGDIKVINQKCIDKCK